MRRALAILKQALVFAALALAAVYIGDYIAIKYRLPNHRNVFGSVVVTPLYAIELKNRETEYQTGAPEPQACVYSLFPHYGDKPCWYLERHPRQRIDIESARPSRQWQWP